MNLALKLKKQLPKNIYNLLLKIGQVADKNNYSIYAVGGFVRDLILGVKNLDIDIVVEKNGIEFAAILSKEVKTALVKYPKFGTATLVFSDKFKLDIATSRSEVYISPGALPQVKLGAIKDDLYRRDFTINAMALSLNKQNFGELIDFFGGLEDLKNKRIRVLHNLSFVDDPTRIFRAVRFEQRYGFKIDVSTQCLIKEAVTLKMFDKISGERFRNEIVLLFSEKEPLRFLLRMEELDQLRFIHPAIKLNRQIKNVFKRVGKNYNLIKKAFPKQEIEIWLIYFAALIKNLSLEEAEKLCRRFVLTRNQVKKITIFKREIDKSLKILKRNNLSKTEIYEALNHFSPEAIILVLSYSDNKRIKEKVSVFLNKLSKIKLQISGLDLERLNIPFGPRYGEVLKQILFLKIDGKIKSKSQELFWAEKLAEKFKK